MVKRILAGDSSDSKARSPLAGTGIREGAVLTHVDGRPVDPVAGPYPLLAGTGGTTVELTFRPAEGEGPSRRVAVMPLVTLFFVVVFGALTLWLQDEVFIKMKPTIVNSLFAAILLGGLAFGKSLLAYVFDAAFSLDEDGWRKLTLRWGLFFLLLAGLNEFVWRSFSTDFWVAFKVWATMPLTIAFMLTQLPLIQRHALHADSSEVQ